MHLQCIYSRLRAVSGRVFLLLVMGCALLVAVLGSSTGSTQATATSSRAAAVVNPVSTWRSPAAAAVAAEAAAALRLQATPAVDPRPAVKAKSAPAKPKAQHKVASKPAKAPASTRHGVKRAPAAHHAPKVAVALDTYRHAPSQRLVRIRQGFDVCSAPPISALRAWTSTGYRTLGIYIGGKNRECSQPLLTAGWVRQATNLGWGLIPTYAGLQAPSSMCGCTSIAPSAAWLQGINSAREAIGEARALGIGPGNPIYDDMEAYQPGWLSTPTVLAYLEAWTITLHASGYVSGVYASLNSGIRDLASRYHSKYAEPDDIWFAHWNGTPSSGDAAIPAGDWAVHRRIHQYIGAATVSRGGVEMNIDVDLADGAVVSAASLSANTH
jgi:hypothetical protein